MTEDVYDIRKGLAELVGSIEDDDFGNNDRYINFIECDITGSLGVWGISQ